MSMLSEMGRLSRVWHECSKKPCAVCKSLFKPRENAKTADTRTLCLKCRKVLSK